MNILIGFDFSINKPACTMIWKDNENIFNHRFLIWPLKLTKKENSIYSDIEDVVLKNREMDSINTKELTSSELARLHTKRSSSLSIMIINDIESEIMKIKNIDIEKDKLYICSEGLSFASIGNASLNLATYKAVLMADLYRQLRTENIYTFSPLTIKSVAGCAKKKDAGEKEAMIDAFMKQDDFDSPFRNMLNNKNEDMRAKKNYIHCIDDIVDSYWAVRTMYKKLKMNDISVWQDS